MKGIFAAIVGFYLGIGIRHLVVGWRCTKGNKLKGYAIILFLWPLITKHKKPIE